MGVPCGGTLWGYALYFRRHSGKVRRFKVLLGLAKVLTCKHSVHTVHLVLLALQDLAHP